MIDAGIGIKTGVNYRGRKSLIGSYHAPVAALIDAAFLDTLDPRALRGGLAEAVKAQTDHELAEQAWLMKTEDHREGIKAVAERRPGRFIGK